MDKILVIKLSAFGDFIQALGPMKAIKNHHPNTSITLLTTKPFKGLAEKSGYFDDIILDERPKWYQFGKLRALKKIFNAGKFGRVYDLQNNDRTGLYFKLFTPKPEWIGAAKGASHRNTSPERTAGLAFNGHVQTLKLAGVTPVTVDTMDWIEGNSADFGAKEPYALIVSGCAPQHPYKRWSAEHYAELCHYLIEQGVQPVLIGTEQERDVTQQIAQACPDALDLTGKTSLFDIVVLAKSAELAVGNDTGPMHMIGPTGCKTLVLFSGNSNPIHHAPLGVDVRTMQKEPIADITPEEVIQKLNS